MMADPLHHLKSLDLRHHKLRNLQKKKLTLSINNTCVNASSKKEALGTYLTISCEKRDHLLGLFVVCIVLYTPCNVLHVYPFVFVAI